MKDGRYSKWGCLKVIKGRENIPQAGLVPALPVFFDSSVPPWPRSSVPEWTTIVRCDEDIDVSIV